MNYSIKNAELQIVNDSQYIDPHHEGPMINWFLNQRCNFTCEYCFFTKRMCATEHSDTGKYTSKYIAECFDRTDKECYIYLSGGESFLYPNFVELCVHLTKSHYLSINTNLSTDNCFEFADKINPKKVYSIEASLHIMEREKRNNLEDYIKHFLYFQEKGFPIQSVYVTYPVLFNRIEKDIQMLKGEGIDIINLKTFRGYIDSKYFPDSYTEDQRSIMKKLAIDKNEILIMENSNSFFGKKCSAGMEYFVMDISGNLRRCHSSTKSYGNFFEGNYKFDTSARSCPFLFCSAPYEGINHTSEESKNIFFIANEIFREAPTYLYLKIRPSKILNYLKRRRITIH